MDVKGKKRLGDEMTDKDYKRIGLKIAPELSDMIVYCISVPFKGTLEDVEAFASKAGGRCETMSSLSEDKAKHVMVTRNRKAFQRYHQKQLSRIYPKVLIKLYIYIYIYI